MTEETDTTTFYFAKFNVQSAVGIEQSYGGSGDEHFRSLILEYVESDEAVSIEETGEWYFGDYEEHDDYILGQFGKQYTREPMNYNKETGKFEEGEEPNLDSDVSFFILHFEDRTLIYNTRDRVRHKNFRENFANGFNDKFDMQIAIEPLRNTTDVERILHNYTVKEGKFKLRSSNPHSDPVWEDLDDEMKEMLAEKLNIEVESVEGMGLDFSSDFLREVLEMSKSNYGDFELIYSDQGQLKVVTSQEEEPIHREEEDPDTLGGLRGAADSLIAYARSFREDG